MERHVFAQRHETHSGHLVQPLYVMDLIQVAAYHAIDEPLRQGPLTSVLVEGDAQPGAPSPPATKGELHSKGGPYLQVLLLLLLDEPLGRFPHPVHVQSDPRRPLHVLVHDPRVAVAHPRCRAEAGGGEAVRVQPQQLGPHLPPTPSHPTRRHTR
jgi:hypothetical protein